MNWLILAGIVVAFVVVARRMRLKERRASGGWLDRESPDRLGLDYGTDRPDRTSRSDVAAPIVFGGGGGFGGGGAERSFGDTDDAHSTDGASDAGGSDPSDGSSDSGGSDSGGSDSGSDSSSD